MKEWTWMASTHSKPCRCYPCRVVLSPQSLPTATIVPPWWKRVWGSWLGDW